MRLFERFSQPAGLGSLHSVVSTTFGIDFGALEQLLLPQFKGAGATNMLVMADPGMMALALAPGAVLPRRAGTDYAVFTPARTGVFHPKIVFQAGRSGARVVVGSANTTWSGLGGNREVVSEIICRAAASPERAFVVAVWTYLRGLVGDKPGPAREALDWLEARTPWLAQAVDEPAERVWTLPDETLLGFFADPRPDEPSIFARFVSQASTAPVEELVIASPYWDRDLSSVRALMEALKPARTRLLIQPRQRLFPADQAQDLPLTVHDIGAPGIAPGSKRREAEAARFSHAKVILVTGGGFDHVLSGSANCTWAAIGSPTASGVNGEASVYRRLPAGSVLEMLGLEEALGGPALDLSAIEPPAYDEPIPLAAAIAARPGEFQITFSALNWRPAAFKPDVVEVELLDVEGAVLGRLQPADWTEGAAGFTARLEGEAEGALFARAIPINPAEAASDLAIITRTEALVRSRRERNDKADKAAQGLRDDPGLDLRYLDLLDLLERQDDALDAGSDGPRKRVQRQRPDAPPEEGRTLSYDDFIKTRRSAPTPQGGEERNSLAGSSPDILRAILNEQIRGDLPPVPPEVDDGASDADFVEEEAVGEDGAPVAPSDEDEDGAPPNTAPSPPKPPVRKTRPRPVVEPRLFTKAVERFGEKMKARFAEDAVGPVEVLRLRTMLLVVLRTADRRSTPGFEPTSQPEGTEPDGPDRYLSLSDSSEGWPRLLISILVAFFHGNEAPITRLAVDPRYDGVPKDFIEAWATTLLALDALHAALQALPALSSLAKPLSVLEASVRGRMGVQPGDPVHEQISLLAADEAEGLRRIR